VAEREATNSLNKFCPEKYKTATAIDRSISSSRAALSNPVQGIKSCKVRQHTQVAPAERRGQRQHTQGSTSKENQKPQIATTKKRPAAGWKRPLGVSGSKRLER
jgi:hypothetical protein